MPYIKGQGWSPQLTFGIPFPPCTHNSSQSVTRLIVSVLTNEVGKAAGPGCDLLMDWKWSESYVTLCWVNNLNRRDLMAGSDSSGWVTALSHESQFLTVFKGLRFCQNWLFSTHSCWTTKMGWRDSISRVPAGQRQLWKHCFKTTDPYEDEGWAPESEPLTNTALAQVTTPHGTSTQPPRRT